MHTEPKTRAARFVAPLLLILAVTAPAVSPLLPGMSAYSESGTLGAAPYRMEVPASWEGTLVVYLHGYTDRGEGGETDVLTPLLAPSALVLEDGGLEDVLLAEGYALAGTAYSENGWAVAPATADARRLVQHAQARIAANPEWGSLERTVVVSCSMGSLVAYGLAEDHAPVADAFVTLGGLGSGTRFADHAVAFQLAYATAFGWPAAWGRPGDVRNAGDDPAMPNDLDFEEEVLPVLLVQRADPTLQGRWEFVRLVLGLPLEGWDGSQDAPSWFVMALLATEGAAEWEARFGGSPAQTVHHRYALSPEDRARIARVDPLLDADALLAAMNGAELASDPVARRAFADASDPTGRLRAPVLAIHSAHDGIVPASLEAAWAEDVGDGRWGRQLLQAYTVQPTHCTFTAPQVLAALRAAEGWADGTAPGPDAFPESLGFMPGHEPAPAPY